MLTLIDWKEKEEENDDDDKTNIMGVNVKNGGVPSETWKWKIPVHSVRSGFQWEYPKVRNSNTRNLPSQHINLANNTFCNFIPCTWYPLNISVRQKEMEGMSAIIFFLNNFEMRFPLGVSLCLTSIQLVRSIPRRHLPSARPEQSWVTQGNRERTCVCHRGESERDEIKQTKEWK